MTLIILSRVSIDACGLFLENIPENAVHDPDHVWWSTEERDVLLETMQLTVTELRTR